MFKKGKKKAKYLKIWAKMSKFFYFFFFFKKGKW